MKKTIKFIGIALVLLLVGSLVYVAIKRNSIPPPEKPAERNLAERVILERTFSPDSVQVLLAEPYSIHAINGDSTIGRQVSVKNGFLNVSSENRQMSFYAIDSDDTLLFAERRIPTEGASNLRDLGGLFTKDGYQVKWGKLFRSDELSSLSDDDFELVSTLGVKSIIDFRTQTEVDEKPDTWPDLDKIDHLHIPIGVDMAGGNEEILENINKENFDWDSLMYAANQGFAMEFQNEYKKFFSLLLEEKQYPLLFHCTAGKDRTGFASLLVLSALGVDLKTALDEYLMTNYYTQGRNEEKIITAAAIYGINPENLRKVMGVKMEFIQGALDSINKEYGSIDQYLCDALGICEEEKEKLKIQLLYKYPRS